ncbi:flavin reductase family protein, partial [Streptomyces sp. L7]
MVTTRCGDGTPRGFTASSFCSVSLEPPMVLVCLANLGGLGAVVRALRPLRRERAGPGPPPAR